MSAKSIHFHPLDDKDLMAAMGCVAVRYAQLDDGLKMTVKTLAGLTPPQARAALEYVPSSELRKWIRTLSLQEVGRGPTHLKVLALLGECKAVADLRNEYIHSIWAREVDGDGGLMDNQGNLRPLPSIEQLEKLDEDIRRLVRELLDARTHGGFLLEALVQKRARTLPPQPPES